MNSSSFSLILPLILPSSFVFLLSSFPSHWYEYVLIVVVGIPAMAFMLWLAWFALKVVDGILTFIWDILTFFSRYK